MPQLKQPFEALVYDFDFTAQIGGETIARINSAVITARGLVTQVAALQIADQAFAGRNARVEIVGGTDGETYLLSLQITDSAEQQYELDAEFAVVDLRFEIPSIASPYLSAQAFVERLGLDEAIGLTDTIGSGRIEVARLATALADAQAEVDGYLAAKYLTPLSTVPGLVAMMVHDLAVARLWSSEAPAGVTERRNAVRRQLLDIVKGAMTLPGADLLTAATVNETPVLFEGGDRLFTRTTLRGF